MLYIVATPIGNLGDITLRALETLKSVDLIAAEDTRHSGHLLKHFEISKPLVSYHEHNEARRTEELIAKLEAGQNIALISDAGLPGVSDPGHRLLRACRERQLPYTVIPGPSAVLTALVGSGFPCEPFYFGGFLPPKSGGRERDLLAAATRAETSVFFESPHRLVRTLEVCAQHFPERRVCVARELTKQFEEFRVGLPGELLAHFSSKPVKGEIVFLVSARERERRSQMESDADEP